MWTLTRQILGGSRMQSSKCQKIHHFVCKYFYEKTAMENEGDGNSDVRLVES